MAIGGDKRSGTLRSRNGVTLAGDVLSPRGNTVRDNPDRGSGRRPDRAARINWPLELLRIFGGLLGVLCGLILIAACIGIAYLSNMMLGVLDDISQRDYSQITTRVDRYAARFESMSEAGFRVQRSEPKILNGEKSFLWVVSPPGSDDRIVYRWKHQLKTNEIAPLTNPALLLDIALGYEKAGSAAGNYSFYDPGDKLAQAMAQRDFSSISPDQIAERWTASQLPSGPVLDPLMTPEAARKRSLKTAEAEEEADPAAGTDPPAPRPDQATDVGGSSPAPPRDGDGTDAGGGSGSGESGGGSGGSDGGSAPPHDDAIPVG